MTEHIHDSIFLNHWLLALYGWVIYQAYLVLFKHWHTLDQNKNGHIEREELWLYFWKHLRNLVFSFICIPAGVIGIEPLWAMISDTPVSDYSYMAAGLASIFLQMFLDNKMK